MKAKIEYLPFVKNDLEEAFIWYKKINPKLAIALFKIIKLKLNIFQNFYFPANKNLIQLESHF
ncbi:MAG: hypothetical protein IPP61_05890 [Cytophagaceae bacterium]|nr:hypothetical protein [Cytophagaceae bacterium]